MLQLQKDLPTGFSGNTWILIETNINWLQRQSHVTLALYKDQSTFESNPLDGIITTQGFDWAGDEFPFTGTADPRDEAYTKIQESKLDDLKVEQNQFATALLTTLATPTTQQNNPGLMVD